MSLPGHIKGAVDRAGYLQIFGEEMLYRPACESHYHIGLHPYRDACFVYLFEPKVLRDIAEIIERDKKEDDERLERLNR